jgi:Zn-dependent protease with chaperone function
LVSERGAAPWCERCAWNLDVYEPPTGLSWWRRQFGALHHRIAYTLTMRQFRAMAQGGRPFGADAVAAGLIVDVKPPRAWSGARVFAIAISLLLYVAMVYLGYLGVWLIQFRFPNLTIVFGVLLLAVALSLLPRFPRLGEHIELLTRAEVPTLFALVDRVAVALGTKAPNTISVHSWFNASTQAIGARRRRHLSLGLALFGALDPQQRVALLAHEMGHFRNADIRSGLITSPAMTTLGRMSELFEGRLVVSFKLRGRGDFTNLVDPIVNLIMATISSAFYMAHLGVLSVTLRDSQRREYLADHRSAQLAGSRATAQLLDLFVVDADAVVAGRARAQELNPQWREAAAQLIAPELAAKVRRLRQLSTRTDVSLWTTHPPAGLRAWLVESTPAVPPSLVLSEADSTVIDAELARYYQRARRDLAQSGV